MKGVRGLGCEEIPSFPNLGFVQPGEGWATRSKVSALGLIYTGFFCSKLRAEAFSIWNKVGLRSGSALDSPLQTPDHSGPLVRPLPLPPWSVGPEGQTSPNAPESSSTEPDPQ